MISAQQRETFEQKGVIRLERLLPQDKIAAARDVVVRALESFGAWRDGRWRFDEIDASGIAGQVTTRIKRIRKAPAFVAVPTDRVEEAVSVLLDGRPFFAGMDRPQLLFTLPTAKHWTVPHSIWHLDVPRLPDGGTPGVQMFTFLDTVAPGGGGTLLVAGSHRLLNTGEHIRSKDVKRRLKRETYFRDLMSRHVTDRARFLDEPARIGDVELKVVELHGEPGDVYLVDMRMLHTLAPNASQMPRMMLTQRFLLDMLRDTIYGPGDEAE